MRIDSTGNVGVGIAVPITELHVASTSTSSQRGIVSSQHTNTTDSARMGSYKSRGTPTSPTTVATGDFLGRWSSFGYDGVNYIESGSFVCAASGTVASARVPSQCSIFTSTDASPSVLTEALRIDNAQLVTILGGIEMGATRLRFTDTSLIRDAANALALRNSTNAQMLRVYNTFTGSADEWLELNWQATANTAVIRTATAGGSTRVLELRYGQTNSVAMRVGTSPTGSTTSTGVILAFGSGSITANTVGRVAIGLNADTSATSGTSITTSIAERFDPTATSTMVAYPLSITPIINYSAGTPGAGSYEAVHIAVTETALPTGTNYLVRALAGAAGATDIFSVTNGGNITTVGTIKSTRATDLGWTVQNAANQACNTTCTTGACVVGLDTGAVGSFLACTDATADTCLCAA